MQSHRTTPASAHALGLLREAGQHLMTSENISRRAIGQAIVCAQPQDVIRLVEAFPQLIAEALGCRQLAAAQKNQ